MLSYTGVAWRVPGTHRLPRDLHQLPAVGRTLPPGVVAIYITRSQLTPLSHYSSWTALRSINEVYTINATRISRELILSRACELVVKLGLEAFSMRVLAKDLGVSAPALYRHFRNREELLIAVTTQAVTIFSQYMYRSLAGPTPRDRFRLAGQEYMNFALDHPRYYEVIHLSRELMGITNPPPEMIASMCSTGQFLVDRVRECMEAGLLRSGDPHERALTIWAHSHGLVSLYLRGFIPLSREEFQDWFHRSFALILAGMGTPGVEWKEENHDSARLLWPAGGLVATRSNKANETSNLNEAR